MKIGMNLGLRKVPVDYFLLHEGEAIDSPKREDIEILKERIHQAIRKVIDLPLHETSVEFYPTCFTRATLIAMDAFAHMGITVKVMEYDWETEAYHHTLTQIPPDPDIGNYRTLSCSSALNVGTE